MYSKALNSVAYTPFSFLMTYTKTNLHVCVCVCVCVCLREREYLVIVDLGYTLFHNRIFCYSGNTRGDRNLSIENIEMKKWADILPLLMDKFNGHFKWLSQLQLKMMKYSFFSRCLLRHIV